MCVLTVSPVPLLSVKSNLAKPTIAFTQHVSREPQDDGYTLLPSSEMAIPEMNESDLSLTYEHSSDTFNMKKTSAQVSKQMTKWFDVLLPSELIH